MVKKKSKTKGSISKIAKRSDIKIKSFSEKKLKYKKLLRKSPRPTLDLRRRPEREVPVKQHGFKEGDISDRTILSQ